VRELETTLALVASSPTLGALGFAPEVAADPKVGRLIQKSAFGVPDSGRHVLRRGKNGTCSTTIEATHCAQSS
jgi:hypothetical protein